jgi:hypothetical protein
MSEGVEKGSGSVPSLPYAARLREQLKTRCVHLRTKAAYFPFPRDDEEANPDPTAIWRCGRTCEPLGPDGSAAHPSECDRAGRRCYEAPPRA